MPDSSVIYTLTGAVEDDASNGLACIDCRSFQLQFSIKTAPVADCRIKITIWILRSNESVFLRYYISNHDERISKEPQRCYTLWWKAVPRFSVRIQPEQYDSVLLLFKMAWILIRYLTVCENVAMDVPDRLSILSPSAFNGKTTHRIWFWNRRWQTVNIATLLAIEDPVRRIQNLWIEMVTGRISVPLSSATAAFLVRQDPDAKSTTVNKHVMRRRIK